MLNAQSAGRALAYPRTDPERRRQQLVEVTIAAMAEVGYEGATLGEIARRAGVSPGLVAHHFESKDGLLAASFRSLVARVSHATLEGLRGVSGARKRVRAVIHAHLGDQDFDERVGAAWLSFWGHVPHDSRLRRLQRVYQGRMLSNLADAFARCGASREPARAIAGMVAAMIDGVWLRAALSGWTEADGADARALLERFVDAEFERLESAAPRSAGPTLGAGGTRLDSAVEAASATQQAWAAAPEGARLAVAWRLAERLGAKTQELARLDAADTGAPVAWTVAAVTAARRWLERASTRSGQTRPASAMPVEFARAWSEPESLLAAPLSGRVGLLGACLQTMGAVVEGAAVQAHASGGTFRSAERLAELFRESGGPPDVLQVVERGSGDVPPAGLKALVLPCCTPVAVVLDEQGLREALSGMLVEGARLPDEVGLSVVFAPRRLARRAFRLTSEAQASSRSGFDPKAIPPAARELPGFAAAFSFGSPGMRVVAFDTPEDLASLLGGVGFVRRASLFGRDLRRAHDIAVRVPVPAWVVNPRSPFDDAIVDLVPESGAGLRRRLIVQAGPWGPAADR